MSIACAFFCLPFYASAQNHNQSHNGTQQQQWTAAQIKAIEEADRRGLSPSYIQENQQKYSPSPSPYGSYGQTGYAQTPQEQASNGNSGNGNSRFDSYFSQDYLEGYTNGGRQNGGNGGNGGGDASMETYYVDETEQIISLYRDNEDERYFTQRYMGAPPSTTPWGVEMEEQAGGHGDWVRGKIRTTSQQLEQKLAQARNKGQAYLVWVNIPSYTLRVINTTTGREVLRTRVIVGAMGTQTPIFSTQIINLKFNPDWSPPPSLLARGKEYTPPGDDNPLGQVRFSTDNSQNIYLHDTNNPQLFDNRIRALSAGCIRVQDWFQLSQILGGLSENEVSDLTYGNATRYKKTPVTPVWTSYERLDMSEYGQMVLYGDIYGRSPLPQNQITRDIQ